MKKSWAILLLVGVLLVACSKDDDDDNTDCVIEDITYTNTMEGLFAGCTFSGCHDGNSINGSLASYDDAKLFVGFGRIVGALKHEAGFTPMPSGRAMWDDCMIMQLETWIADGTPE